MNQQEKVSSPDQDDCKHADSDLTRRELIRRGGIYAAATPVLLATLMSPATSHAITSLTDPYWDNGPP